MAIAKTSMTKSGTVIEILKRILTNRNSKAFKTFNLSRLLKFFLSSQQILTIIEILKRILTNRNSKALRWANESFYYLKQARNMYDEVFPHPISDCCV